MNLADDGVAGEAAAELKRDGGSGDTIGPQQLQSLDEIAVDPSADGLGVNNRLIARRVHHGCSGHSWNYPGHCRVSHRCFNVQEALMKTALLASVAALSVLSTSVAYAADENDPPLPR